MDGRACHIQGATVLERPSGQSFAAMDGGVRDGQGAKVKDRSTGTRRTTARDVSKAIYEGKSG